MKKRRPPLRRKYRNRNRSWDTRQNTVAIPLKGAMLIVLGMVVGVAGLLLRHANESLSDAIAREESRKTALTEEVRRETAKWNQKRSTENLRAVLLRNGIAMGFPSGRQIVAMRGPGARPVPAAGSPAVFAANR